MWRRSCQLEASEVQASEAMEARQIAIVKQKDCVFKENARRMNGSDNTFQEKIAGELIFHNMLSSGTETGDSGSP